MAKLVFSLLVVLAVAVTSEPISRPWAASRIAVPVVRRQGGVPVDCTFFEAPGAEETCEDIANRWGITVKDFTDWNPSLGADCSGIDRNKEYCVERNWGNPLPTSSSSTIPTSTSAGSGPTSAFPSPVQEGIIKTCNAFYKTIKDVDTCDGIVTKYGTFTLEQFLSWNPALGSDCKTLWGGTYYCVGVPGTPTARPTSTTSTRATTTGTGVVKPSPTQSGLIDTCVRFYEAVQGDTCDTIVAAHGTFTLAQFLAWNPAVGSDCRQGLWADTYYCVGVPDTPTTIRTTTTTTQSTSTTTTATNGIVTPSPTQGVIAKNCDKFHFVQEGETCKQLAARYGISVQQFYEWNPSVGANCETLWFANACVHTIGYVYPVTANCYTTSDNLLWGDNRPAALTSVGYWCDGNSDKDGVGAYTPNQVKTGCYNAPFGNIKIGFWLRNEFGVDMSLSQDKCNQLVKMAVERCDRGGYLSLESWFVMGTVTEGRCP
ncbi:hypothetical protein FALCPG4_002159 [Fusarium falciforme]